MSRDVDCPRCGNAYPPWLGSCPACSPDAPRARTAEAAPDERAAKTPDARPPKAYCPHCARTYPRTSDHCPRCPPTKDPSKGGRCPRCSAALAPVEMGSATVDRCGGCGGLWFDRGEVERVMRLDVSGTRPDARSMSAWPKWRATERDVRYVPCVRCGERMARRAIAPRAGPVVDLCRAHGIWFDGGEFEHFRAFADAGGLDMATEEEARKADLEREREKEVDALQRFDAERRPGRSHGLLATDASDRVFGPASVWSVLRSLRRGIRR